MYINLAYEDELSSVVLRRLLVASGRDFKVHKGFWCRGFGNLKTNIAAYNNAAKGVPFLVLTDLDNDDCAPAKLRSWLPGGCHPNLLFRIAVKEVESWLLADRDNLARFLGIRNELIPHRPEELPDPKAELIRLAAHYCRNSSLRESIAPRQGSTSRQGPDYNAKMAVYVNDYWDPVRAAEYSDSLRKTLRAVSEFVSVSK